jgi:acyl-protein synthetase LuxE
MTDAATVDLDNRIRNFIITTQPARIAFDRLALELFAYQYERNEPYRRYCDIFDRSPANVKTWRDIPAVPAASFASARLACFPPESTTVTFSSSGTTSGSSSQSTLDLDSTTLYDASLLEHYRARVIPDAVSMRMIALAPTFEEAPHSSLSYMLSRIASVLGEPGGGFFVRDGHLAFEALCAALREGAEPVVVFGTAFSFVHFFDRCRAEGISFRLPIGSRVVETGGFKGKSREISREELYAGFGEYLGVPRVLCISEYGMCELGSQWYDANLDDYFSGRPPRVHLKMGPHWARVMIVDPITAEPVREGQEGLVHIFDLSNRGSVSAILTADVARAQDGGFVLLGRFAGAPPKGCSIAADALLSAGDD